LPHIIVEHSKDISKDVCFKSLNQDLHNCLAKQETVSLKSIKTRSVEVDNVIVGSGEANNFIHINVLLLSGRSEELKSMMADSLFKIAQNYIYKFNCVLSVNISELGTYKK